MPRLYRHTALVGLAAFLSGSGLWTLTHQPARHAVETANMEISSTPTAMIWSALAPPPVATAAISTSAPPADKLNHPAGETSVPDASPFAPPIVGSHQLRAVAVERDLRDLLPPAPVDLLSVRSGRRQPVQRIAEALPITAITHTEDQSWVWFTLLDEVARLLSIAEADGARLVVTRAHVADDVTTLDQELLVGTPRRTIPAPPLPAANPLQESTPHPAVLPDTSGGDFFGEIQP